MSQDPASRAEPGGEGASLAALLQRLDTLRRVVLRRAELNAADMRLLWLLSDGRARTFREISEDLALEQSTVNRQVNGAARTQLVQIAEGHPARQVRATDEGVAAYRSDVDRILASYGDALERMGPARTAELTDLLAEFIDAYQHVVRPEDTP
ncbi:MarR family winged helix-turn-helix transcriptional regulator [Ruania albidiflava]|uniref:MarR family winged helix-turn-helix transcriptional regulator n=1 Tax=Ruania albidiflava TaxID=366586 RepID=UPI0003B62400|nr:MarR family winged helix-turn-helix transcriptional regulator [Ruania albidiflava]